MKMRLVLLGLAAVLIGWVQDACGFYNPSTGRWLSRDPIGEEGGYNIYGFVKNNPVSRIDYLGLWYRGDHERMTRGAWNSVFMPAEMRAYQHDMADVLVHENRRVDRDWENDNYWHFNRGLSENVDVAKTAYVSKLCGKDYEIQTLLAAPSKDNCDKALRIEGNMSHAFQDYYAHGIAMNSDGSKATVGMISGTPDSPGANMKPSSWGNWYWDRGEHGATEPGSRAPDEANRKSQAQTYTGNHFKPFAASWWPACKCYAKTLFGH